MIKIRKIALIAASALLLTAIVLTSWKTSDEYHIYDENRVQFLEEDYLIAFAQQANRTLGQRSRQIDQSENTEIFQKATAQMNEMLALLKPKPINPPRPPRPCDENGACMPINLKEMPDIPFSLSNKMRSSQKVVVYAQLLDANGGMLASSLDRPATIAPLTHIPKVNKPKVNKPTFNTNKPVLRPSPTLKKENIIFKNGLQLKAKESKKVFLSLGKARRAYRGDGTLRIVSYVLKDGKVPSDMQEYSMVVQIR